MILKLQSNKRFKKTPEEQFMAGQTTPGPRTLPRNKGLIAGLIKGNQWLISPYFWGGTLGGVAWLAMSNTTQTTIYWRHFSKQKQLCSLSFPPVANKTKHQCHIVCVILQTNVEFRKKTNLNNKTCIPETSNFTKKNKRFHPWGIYQWNKQKNNHN